MGKRDYSHREQKKTKKDSRKVPQVSALPASVNVEVIQKKRKTNEEEGE